MFYLLVSTCITWQCVADISADEYGVDRRLVRAMVMVESGGCKHIYNRKTKDYGCLQVNKVHLKGRKDMQRFSDYRFSIPEGVAIVSKLKRPCQYNLGKLGARKNPLTCAKYERKLKHYGWRKHGY